MAETKPQTGKPTPPADANGSEPGPKCSPCGDTGQVCLKLEGITGPVLQTVACPECQNGVSLSGGPRYEDLDQRVTLMGLALLVLVVGFGLFVWTYRNELESYAKEAVPNG